MRKTSPRPLGGSPLSAPRADVAPWAVVADALRRRNGGRSVLAEVSLRVASGEALGVVGSNGSGKTTLLRILGGLLRPHAGRVFIFGYDTQAAPEAARRRTGIVAHEPCLYAGMTVVENLRLFRALYQTGRPPVPSEDLDALLTETGLASRAHDLVRSLSRGWAQRAAIARALIPKPDLLILDEPFTGLDAAGGAWLRARLAHHLGRGGAILVSTHRPEEFDGLRVRLSRLERGRLRAE
jgi:heme ABC exporter ATP-binding subunit CcmA